MDETKEIFKGVAAAAGAMKVSAADAQGIFKAFGQIISKGQIQAEEIRGQLGERLPGAFGILADSIGVTTSELNEMLEQGQVGLAELEKFGNRLQQLFSRQAASNVQSLRGAFSLLKNDIFEMNVTFAEATNLEKNLVAALQTLEGVVESITKSMPAIISGFKNVASAAVGALAAVATFKTVTAISVLTTQVGTLSAAFLTLQARALNALLKIKIAFQTLSKTTAIGLGLSTIVGIFTAWRLSADEAKSKQEQLNESINDSIRQLRDLNNIEIQFDVDSVEAQRKILNNNIDRVQSRLEKLKKEIGRETPGVGFNADIDRQRIQQAIDIVSGEGQKALSDFNKKTQEEIKTVAKLGREFLNTEKALDNLTSKLVEAEKEANDLKQQVEESRNFQEIMGKSRKELEKVVNQFSKGTQAFEEFSIKSGKIDAIIERINQQLAKAAENSDFNITEATRNSLIEIRDSAKSAKEQMQNFAGVDIGLLEDGFNKLTQSVGEFEEKATLSRDKIRSLASDANNFEILATALERNIANIDFSGLKDIDKLADFESLGDALNLTKFDSFSEILKQIKNQLREINAQNVIENTEKEIERQRKLAQVTGQARRELERYFEKLEEAGGKTGTTKKQRQKIRAQAEEWVKLKSAQDKATKSTSQFISEFTELQNKLKAARSAGGEKEFEILKKRNQINKAIESGETSLQKINKSLGTNFQSAKALARAFVENNKELDKLVNSFEEIDKMSPLEKINEQLDRQLSIAGLSETRQNIAKEVDAIKQKIVEGNKAIEKESEIGDKKLSKVGETARRKVFQDRAGELISDAQTERQRERIKKIGREFIKQKTDPEEFAKKIGLIEDRIKKVEEFSKKATKSIQENFAEFLFDPFESNLEDMFGSFVTTLRKMAAEAASKNIIRKLFGSGPQGGPLGGLRNLIAGKSEGLLSASGQSNNLFSGVAKSLGFGSGGGFLGGGFAGDGAGGTGLIADPTRISPSGGGGFFDSITSSIGSFFGGLFANGGVAPGGKMSIVGENGPEAIIPENDTSVIPNNELGKIGGNRPGNLTVNINNAPSQPRKIDRRIDDNGDEIIDVSFDPSDDSRKERLKEEFL